jgi:hypothetical protein
MSTSARAPSFVLIVVAVAVLACALAGAAGAGTMPTTYTPGTYYTCEVTHDPITMSLWQIGPVTFPDARTLCVVDIVSGSQLADGWCQDGQLWDNAWLWEIDNELIAYARHATTGPATVSDGSDPFYSLLTFPAGTLYYTTLRPSAQIAVATFDGQTVGAQYESTESLHIVDTSTAEAVGTC